MLKMKSLLIGCESENYIKQFTYYEDFEKYYKENVELFGYLRFVQFEGDVDDLCKYLSPPVSCSAMCKREKRDVKINVISKKNEISVLKKLREIANKCLGKYPNSYEIDEKMLKKELSYNQRNCVIYRMQEKKIYKKIIEMTEFGLLILSKKYKAAVKYYNSLKDKPVYKQYVENTLIPLLK